jgi:hypothetical protein
MASALLTHLLDALAHRRVRDALFLRELLLPLSRMHPLSAGSPGGCGESSGAGAFGG